MQRSAYTADGGLALVYDIIQKVPYALSLTQHTASTVPSVVGRLFSQHGRHHKPFLEELRDACNPRQVPTSHSHSQVALGRARLDATTSRASVDDSSCLFSGKGSDNPRVGKFPSPVLPCPIRVSRGPLLLGKHLPQGPVCPLEASQEAVLIHQAESHHLTSVCAS